jgi:exopolyphosphatase/pppGpp-phosphohydrolase
LESDLILCRKSATQFIAEFLAPELRAALDCIPPSQRSFVGCGGTACALQRILCRGTLETPTSIFRLPALQALIARLWSIPRAQRVAEGVAATRADSILTGSVIVESLMLGLDIPEISVSNYGMRHGAILAASEATRWSNPSPSDSRFRPVSVD